MRLESLTALRGRDALSDEEMVNAQRTSLIDSTSPNPSVETLLHGFLRPKFIDHSHADAVLALIVQADAEAICKDVYGGRLAIVPYIMPGFALAKAAAAIYDENPEVEGLLLLKHGLFTFGDTARESYERHVAAVDAAERFASNKGARTPRRVSAQLSYETLSYLNVVANPKDNLSWHRLLLLIPGVGRQTAARFTDQIKGDFGLDQALQWLKTRKQAPLKDLGEMLDMLKDQGQTLVSRLNLAPATTSPCCSTALTTTPSACVTWSTSSPSPPATGS